MPTLTNAERRHLKRASEVAALGTMRYRHGAVIAKGKRVLAVGVNSTRNHQSICSDPKRESSIHAEVAVLRQLRYDVPYRAVLFVARIAKDGSPVLSMPCSNCREEIRKAGIRQVVFTTDEGWGYLGS